MTWTTGSPGRREVPLASATWSPSVAVIIAAGTGSVGDTNPCLGVIISGSHRSGIGIPPVAGRLLGPEHFPLKILTGTFTQWLLGGLHPARHKPVSSLRNVEL